MKNSKLIFVAFVISVLFIPVNLFAHTINYDVQSLSSAGVAGYYIRLGFTHILPLGFDHILFILGIFFLNPNLRSVLWQATAFTVAHSITLALAASGTIHPLSSVIEPIIALSIAFIAIENIFITKLKWWRILIVFAFGLVHGMGFAGALAEIGLPEKNFLSSIISFNIGVELGQITVILLANYILVNWIKNKEWYRPRFLIPASACIAVFALWLTYERLMA
ncbi:MAG: HupE/UreJ family protein [Bacteroidota bacterium]